VGFGFGYAQPAGLRLRSASGVSATLSQRGFGYAQLAGFRLRSTGGLGQSKRAERSRSPVSAQVAGIAVLDKESAEILAGIGQML